MPARLTKSRGRNLSVHLGRQGCAQPMSTASPRPPFSTARARQNPYRDIACRTS